MLAAAISLTWNEALSGVTGSVSLASWIFLLVPQLIENYQQGSAEGISLTFLLIWFVGDVTNLAGALWAGLVPTVVALAVYFCFADAILIGQCLYYNALNRRTQPDPSASTNGAPHDQTPLLNGDHTTSPTHKRQTSTTSTHSTSNLGLPGSHRRSSTASSTKLARNRTNSSSHTLEPILEKISSTSRTYLKNTLSVLMILVVGAAGWAIAWKTGAWQPTPVGNEEGGSGAPAPIGAEVLGYISAVCYLGARIPQIVKNQRERSVDGLSLLFFCLSLLGNATYGAGILFHSVEREYLMTNLPWLIGSLGTMGEDVMIFVQFRVFGERVGEKEEEVEEEEGESAAVG